VVDRTVKERKSTTLLVWMELTPVILLLKYEPEEADSDFSRRNCDETTLEKD